MVARAALLLALSVALSILVTAVQVSEAHASEQGCYVEDGSWIENCDTYFQPAPSTSDDGWLILTWTKGTRDVCADYVAASDKSAAQALADSYIAQGYASTPVHYTDTLYTKTPACSGGSSTPVYLSQQGNPAELRSDDTQDVRGCFTVDVSDPVEVTQQEFVVLTRLGFHGNPADKAEQLYSPDCFNGKEVWELDDTLVQQLREDPCYDVVGDTPNLEDAVVEFVGCPSELDRIATTQAKQAGYTGKSVHPVSQQEGPIAQPGGTGATAAKTAELIAKSNAMLRATQQYAPKKKGA
jgi:hypothetical protein